MQEQNSEKVLGYRPLAALVPAGWQSGEIEAADGARIHYTRTGGAKPPVLLLHGLQANGHTWLRTAQALEQAYDVVMPDFRGHGQSSRAGADVSPDTLVQDTIGLLDTLGLAQPFVVGHSMGADIAGRLAAAHPARAVVLVDLALRRFAGMPAGGDPPPWMQPIIAAMRALRTQPHAERMITGLSLLPPGTPVFEEADYVSFVEALAQFDLPFFRSAAAMGYLFEEPALIAQIACPILLLTARPMMPGMDSTAGLAAFERSWRNGRHVHFANCGHFLQFEQFERFIDVLTRFMADCKL